MNHLNSNPACFSAPITSCPLRPVLEPLQRLLSSRLYTFVPCAILKQKIQILVKASLFSLATRSTLYALGIYCDFEWTSRTTSARSSYCRFCFGCVSCAPLLLGFLRRSSAGSTDSLATFSARLRLARNRRQVDLSLQCSYVPDVCTIASLGEVRACANLSATVRPTSIASPEVGAWQLALNDDTMAVEEQFQICGAELVCLQDLSVLQGRLQILATKQKQMDHLFCQWNGNCGICSCDSVRRLGTHHPKVCLRAL